MRRCGKVMHLFCFFYFVQSISYAYGFEGEGLASQGAGQCEFEKCLILAIFGFYFKD